MDKVLEILSKPIVSKAISSIVIIIISIILYTIITNLLMKELTKDRWKRVTNKKTQTYARLIKSISRYIFIIATFLFILQIFGVNISSVIAGVGVLGVVFGLAIQDWIKDIIRGTTILSDNYFQVGDIVKYNGIEGKVLVLGLKSTKIQDLKTSNIISIANRNIEQIEVVSNIIYVRIPMPYEVKIDKAEKAIKDIIEIVKSYEKVEDCSYKGVTELADSSIQYLIEVKCNPVNKLQVNRDTIRSIIVGLDKNNIEVPFNQIDVHQK